MSFSIFVWSIFYRCGGEEQESRFCDTKQVSMPTLRMTWEAKNQLKQILLMEVSPLVRHFTAQIRSNLQRL